MGIKDHVGKIVEVDLKDKNKTIGKIEGRLDFFDFNSPVIHLTNYTKKVLHEKQLKVKVEYGDYIVLNVGDWGNLRVNEGKK